MAARTSIIGGTVPAPLDWKLSTTWVGGVVPGAGDTHIIPTGSNVALTDAAGNWLFDVTSRTYVAGSLKLDASIGWSSGVRGILLVEFGGVVTAKSICTNGLVEVKSGGTYNAWAGGTNRGLLLVVSGGIGSTDNGTNNGLFLVEPGGSGSIINGINAGMFLVDSGGAGSMIASTNNGIFGAYSGANITGDIAAVSLGTERRTTHFTGDLANQITILGTGKRLEANPIITSAGAFRRR